MVGEIPLIRPRPAAPDPKDPKLQQQAMATILYRMACAAGGCLVLDMRELMTIVPMSVKIVQEGDMTAFVIEARPQLNIAAASADALDKLPPAPGAKP